MRSMSLYWFWLFPRFPSRLLHENRSQLWFSWWKELFWSWLVLYSVLLELFSLFIVVLIQKRFWTEVIKSNTPPAVSYQKLRSLNIFSASIKSRRLLNVIRDITPGQNFKDGIVYGSESKYWTAQQMCELLFYGWQELFKNFRLSTSRNMKNSEKYHTMRSITAGLNRSFPRKFQTEYRK